MTAENSHGHVATCSCGKRVWRTKRDAAAVARRMRQQGGDNVRPYRSCSGTGWHLGHPMRFPGPDRNDPRLRWIHP